MLVLQFGVMLLAAYLVLRVLSELRASPLMRVVYALLDLVPILSVLTVVAASANATILLRLCGARVGLLRTPGGEWKKLLPGACHGCGYDRNGLKTLAPGPECSRIPIVW